MCQAMRVASQAGLSPVDSRTKRDRRVCLPDGKRLDGGDFELELVLGFILGQAGDGQERQGSGDNRVQQFHALLYGLVWIGVQ